MNDKVQGESDPMPFYPFEEAHLMRVGFCAGDFVCGVLARALKTELDVIETGFDQRGKFCLVHGQAGGDEVDVQAGGACGTNEIHDVRSRERFASGEIGLEDSCFGGFVEDTRPDFGGELVAASLQFEWVGAVNAMQ